MSVFLLLPSRVEAAVVINEVLPNPSGSSSEPHEFIELYNTHTESIDLSGWQLDDIADGGSSPYTIGTTIDPLGFVVFRREDTAVALNNSGDTVRLVDDTGDSVDIYTYTSTAEDVAIGRSVDGSGTFTVCQSITEGAANDCPLPTATPAPTHTPTSTPKPTSIPSSTHTPTHVRSEHSVTPELGIPTAAYDDPLSGDILEEATSDATIEDVLLVPEGTGSVYGHQSSTSAARTDRTSRKGWIAGLSVAAAVSALAAGISSWRIRRKE